MSVNNLSNYALTGKIALVTGATRGIGFAIAKCFAANGVDLLLTGKATQMPSLLADEPLFSRINVSYFPVDFLASDALEDFLHKLQDTPQIDICINNAGINIPGDTTEIDDVSTQEIMKVNILAPLKIVKAVSPRMRQNQFGRIVNIGSVYGTISNRRRILYSMTKNALNGLTVSAAIELAQSNILVNTVSPGFVHTDLLNRHRSLSEIEDLARKVPLRRIAQPNEIAEVVAFVASPANTYITGQTIIVDGGYSIS